MLPALVTAWLLALQSWRAWRGSSLAALGGLTLGLSAWTQPAGVLTVPIAFALGYVLIAPEPRSRRVLAIAAVAALVPFVIDALWLLRHPDAYIDTLGRWAIHIRRTSATHGPDCSPRPSGTCSCTPHQ